MKQTLLITRYFIASGSLHSLGLGGTPQGEKFGQSGYVYQIDGSKIAPGDATAAN